MARGRSSGGRSAGARRGAVGFVAADAAPFDTWMRDTQADLAHPVALGAAHAEIIRPVRIHDIDDFARRYWVHSSEADPDHLLGWAAGITRSADGTEIWLLGRVITRDSDGASRIFTAAFPIQHHPDPELDEDAVMSELTWDMSNRVVHDEGPMSPEEFDGIVEFDPSAPIVIHDTPVPLRHRGQDVSTDAISRPPSVELFR